MKLAILRALSPGRRSGVAWWLHPTHGPVGDGKHTGYLNSPEKWRHLDPDLFDALKRIVTSGHRYVSGIENASLLPGATFFSETIPVGGPAISRPARRSAWFSRLDKHLEGCDLVFIDPDNGLEPDRFSILSGNAGRSVGLAELNALARPGRALIVYHHQTRRKGGHLEELAYWADRLRESGFERVDVLRANPFSARAFFILGSDEVMRHRAVKLSEWWKDRISWHVEPSLVASSLHARCDIPGPE